jgi:hypothetical protein
VLVRIAAILVAVPLAVLATYAWLFPVLNIKSYSGLIIGVLIAAALGFRWLKPAVGLVGALAGAALIGSLVLYCSLFLLLNILGE